MTQLRTHLEERVTERERESSSTSGSSSTTTYHTDPGVLLDPIDLEAIRTGYEDVLGMLNSYKARDIEVAIQCGMRASAILDALEQTAIAPRPSHAYFRAILRRYMAFRIFTDEDAERDREEYAARREAANRERAAWYRDPLEDLV